MIYYALLALAEIGFFLSDNWKELTGAAIASGIGVILGKRLGTRIAINYIMRTLGLHKKPKIEQQVAWLIELERGRGNIWSAERRTSRRSIIGQSFRSRWVTTFRVLSAKLFTRRTATHQLTLRGKKSMNLLKSNLSKKLTVTITATLLIALNDKFSLQMSQETIYVIAGIVATYVAGQSHVDAKKETNKAIQIGDSGPAE